MPTVYNRGLFSWAAPLILYSGPILDGQPSSRDAEGRLN